MRTCCPNLIRPRAAELLVCALVLLPMLFYPLARDQGLFAYAGQVVLDGGAPYADVYEQKGPATHYTYALVMGLLGESTLSLRLFFYAVALAGSQLAAAIGARLRDADARLPCAIVYSLVAIFALPRGPWTTGQVEDLLLPLSLGIVLLIHDESQFWKYRNLAFVSLLLGLMCVYKPTSAVLALAVAGYTGIRLAMHSALTWRDVAQRFAVCSVSFFLPAMFFGIVLAVQGALDDFWLFVVEHNATVYAKLHSGTAIKWARTFVGHWGGTGLLAVFSLAAGYRTSRSLWTMLWLVVLSGVGALYWQHKSFIYYHWTPLVGALSIFAALSLDYLLRLTARVSPHLAVTCVLQPVVLAAGLFIVATQPWAVLNTYRETADVLAGRQSIVGFRDPYRCGADTSQVNRLVSHYIKTHSRPDDTLLVWGYDVVLNFLSDRRAPTRFAMNRILMVPFSPHCHEWREEFMRDLRQRPPQFIVVADEPTEVWYLGNPRELVSQFPAFHTFLETQYVQHLVLGKFILYQRRTAAGGQHTSAALRQEGSQTWFE